MPSNVRILLVSHNFPPTLGPESTLVRLNTIDLVSRGWEVSVLTTTTEHMHQSIDFGMLEGLPDEVEIIRTPSYDAVLVKKWRRLGRLILMAMRKVLPEFFLLWLISSVPAGKRWLRGQKGKVIIYSRATKHVSNVAGWFLKRATGMPWVAHFSDPWLTAPNHNRFQKWLVLQLENRIFRDADAVVTVSPKLADHILCAHSWARHKVHVIPHGYAPLDKAPMPLTGAGTRPLQALHAGSFTPTLREPDSLFAALVLLNQRMPLSGRLKLSCVGDDTTRYQGMVDKMGLNDIVSLVSSVPYQVCQDMIDRSDLLLVIDTPGYGGIFLPTKLIEYLPYAKPVMGLTEPESTIHELLRECDLTFADQAKPEGIAEALEGLLKRWEAGSWGVSEKFHEHAARYRIERVNEALDKLLISLV